MRQSHCTDTRELSRTTRVSSFGVDADGELYIVNHSSGRVVRITAPLVSPSTPTGLTIINP